MDDFVLRIFQSEVALQCRFVLFGADDLAEVERRAAELRTEGTKEYLDLEKRIEGAIEAEDWDEVRRLTSPQMAVMRFGNPGERVGRTWFALQAILSAAANLSKLLWGEDDRQATQAKRDQRKAERQVLRDSLGVTDDSPLKERKVRNLFEHFDEKLERRFRDPKKRRGYVGRNLGGDPPDDPFGHYQPETDTVWFWDQSVLIPDLVTAARNLLPVAESESNKSFGGG